MKKLVRILLFIPIAALIVPFFFSYCEGRADEHDNDVFSCLVSGYDEAAENTDVIFVFSYSSDKNKISVIQIPRDSFSEYYGAYGKINRIFSLSRANGKSRDKSLEELSCAIESYLGIKLDASIAISPGATQRLIDNIGGVYVNIPESVSLDEMPIKLSYGENLLTGRDALSLIRERKSYPTGDLGRLDAQKIFIEGTFHTLFERLDAKKLAKLLLTKDEGLTVDAPFTKLATLILRDFNKIKDADLTLLTLPGEPCEYAGVSYYVVNKRAATDALNKYFEGSGKVFDEEYKFTDERNPTVNEIYERQSFSYKVYAQGRVIDIKLN